MTRVIQLIKQDPTRVEALNYVAQLNLPQCYIAAGFVRNQAIMHPRNGDSPYLSVLDAMSYWPEKETAIAVRQVGFNRYESISAFGFQSLFNFCITHNHKRSRELFETRLNAKGWLKQWPSLKVVLNDKH
jgi:hypothetical protein